MICTVDQDSCVKLISDLIIPALALLVAIIQLWIVRKELRLANVEACFTFEVELFAARRKFGDCLRELDAYDGKDKKRLTELWLAMKEARESFFNILDRLCAYILQGKLKEGDFREDYAPMLREVVGGFEETLVDGNYQHIRKLNAAWNSQDSIGDEQKYIVTLSSVANNS